MGLGRCLKMSSKSLLLSCVLLFVLLPQSKITECFPQNNSVRKLESSSSSREGSLTQRISDSISYKGYSGYRVRNDSLRMVYYHDQTIAIAEIGNGRSLLSCELIEVFNDAQALHALKNLTKTVNRPHKLRFKEMMELMSQCDKLQPPPQGHNHYEKKNADNPPPARSLMLGILPGTKWCGTGDIAETYFDLGEEESIDKCCRMHDLCPVKVRAHSARYNLTNKSIYTKSHCACDDELLKCLKSKQQSTADFMGNIYFNILRIPCVQKQTEEPAAAASSFRDPLSY